VLPALDLVEAELHGGDPDQARHVLKLIRESLRATRDDAAALAHWAREAHAEHPVEEVDLPAALAGLARGEMAAAGTGGGAPADGGPGLTVTVAVEPPRRALRWGGLAAALRPLIANARGHHDLGAIGAVSVRAALDGDTLVVTVEDDGPGLEHPERRALLLRKGRRELRGMGLPWAYSACGAHGASLDLLPAAPRGLKAVVRWPMPPLPR